MDIRVTDEMIGSSTIRRRILVVYSSGEPVMPGNSIDDVQGRWPQPAVATYVSGGV